MIMISNYTLDDMVPLEYIDMVDHLERLYNKENGDAIDYETTMADIIIERYMYSMDEDDFLE